MRTESLLVVVLLSAFGFMGCIRTPPSQPGSSPSSVESTSVPRIGDTISVSEGYARLYEADDTTCFFHRAGHSYRVIVRKTYLDAPAFQAFLDQHSPDSVAFRGVEVADVTGDGVPDSCVTNIRELGGLPFIEHIVRSGGRQVFYDSLTVDDPGGAEILWGDEYSYTALKPYSGIFAARTAFGSFLGGQVDPDEEITKEFIDRHKSEKAYWIDYLGRFKGHLIWYLNLTDAGLKVWDGRSGGFIDFLVP